VPTRIALGEETSRDAIDAAMEANGWRLCNVFVASEKHPFQILFTDAGREGTLHFVDDARLDAAYCLASSDALAEQVRASLAAYTDDAIRGLAGTPRGVILAALGLPSDEARAIVRAARTSDDAALRAAGALAEPYL